MNFGDKLKEERKKKGISQKELGQKLGVSQAMIAQYEKGDRTPKIETIKKIAKALEVEAIVLTGYRNKNSNIENIIKLFSGGAAYLDISVDESLEKLGLTENDLDVLKKSIKSNQEGTEKELLINYRKLNNKGQEKAVEQVEMLTKIDEYTKKDD